MSLERGPCRLLQELNPRPVDNGSERALGEAATGEDSQPDIAARLKGLGPKR